MRCLIYGALGLFVGAAGGFWLGLMVGLIYAELAKVSCFEGLCGDVAVSFGLGGALGLGLAGGALGLRRASRHRPLSREPSPVR